MQELKPEIDRIRDEHREDPQRMQQEVMRLYRDRNLNPLGSCLPVLLQVPIFIGIFYVILEFGGSAGMIGGRIGPVTTATPTGRCRPKQEAESRCSRVLEHDTGNCAPMRISGSEGGFRSSKSAWIRTESAHASMIAVRPRSIHNTFTGDHLNHQMDGARHRSSRIIYRPIRACTPTA